MTPSNQLNNMKYGEILENSFNFFLLNEIFPLFDIYIIVKKFTSVNLQYLEMF